MNTYDIGDKVVMRAEFRDVNKDFMDPDVVNFSYRKPDRTKTNLSYIYGYIGEGGVIRIDTGIYEVTLPITQSGSWFYRFYATGAGQSAGEGQFKVRESYFVDA